MEVMNSSGSRGGTVSLTGLREYREHPQTEGLSCSYSDC